MFVFIFLFFIYGFTVNSGEIVDICSHGNLNCIDSVQDATLEQIDAEINIMDKIISAQSRKLELLRSSRRKALAGEKLTVSDNIQLHFDSDSEKLSEIMVLKNEITTNFSLLEIQFMSLKVRQLKTSKRASPEILISLVAAVDVTGVLHIYDIKKSEELFSLDLAHGAIISAVAYDGSDSKLPLFASAAVDGSVHITCLEIMNDGIVVGGPVSKMLNSQNNSIEETGVSVTASVCSKYNINKNTFSVELNNTANTSAYESVNISAEKAMTSNVYATSLVLSAKGQGR